MAAFNKSKMSADEWQFIHTYCKTLQKDYYLLQMAAGLMAPKGLAIKCPAEATAKAKKLQQLQSTYCNRIEALGTLRKDKKDDTVTAAMLANIFVASFFKLVDSETKQVFITNKGLPAHDGWSSGHPADWQQTIHSLKELHDQTSGENQTKHGTLFNIIFNLFMTAPKQYKDTEFEDEQKSYSSSANTFEASPEYDYEEEYDEEYDEDDDDSDYDDLSAFM